MAGQNIASRPFGAGLLASLAALPSRHIRLTVFLCVVAIGGSFAAAGALQMRFQTASAERQAVFFETERAKDIAAAAAATLQRQTQAAERYASGEMLTRPPDVTGITVADLSGMVTGASGEPIAMAALAGLLQEGEPVVTGMSDRTLLVFRKGGHLIAISFRPLVPDSVMRHAVITGAGDTVVAGARLGGNVVAAAVPGWPLRVEVAAQNQQAMAAWVGALPLYLFVILGPALVGAWLATVFVREFERRAKATEAIRALRTTHPAEAKLLVRLANAERAAAEAAHSKNEFIAHMSHELRTPLNAVIGFAEVIEHGLYGPAGHAKYVEYAHDIAVAGRQLHDKVGDILEFANLEAGRYPLKLSRFDAVMLVEATVADHAGRAFSRRIDLSMTPADSALVIADPSGVRRVMTHLLANALLYTPEGGRVSVSVTEEAGAVAIAVRDSGSGFSASEKAAAGTPFRRFERVGVSTGAGLGLAIAVALARRMGGALRLDSAPGKGTRAELRLPRG